MVLDVGDLPRRERRCHDCRLIWTERRIADCAVDLGDGQPWDQGCEICFRCRLPTRFSLELKVVVSEATVSSESPASTVFPSSPRINPRGPGTVIVRVVVVSASLPSAEPWSS
jgi:hypothetical protein